MNKLDRFEVAVVGAGPAGLMAAFSAASKGHSVTIYERNTTAGKKLLLTGNGRCNLTNTTPFREFVRKFGKKGAYLRSAISKFSSKDLMDYFESRNLDLKVEEGGRVFPVTDESISVLKVLEKSIKKLGINIVYNSRLKALEKKDEFFILTFNNSKVEAENVIIATGGCSYPNTGSTGDGHKIALKTGHDVTQLLPGIVPLKTREKWVKDLQGITLDGVKLTMKHPDSKMVIEDADLLFTHYGISGPSILDNSSKIVQLLETGDVHMTVDLLPVKSDEDLREEFLNAVKTHGKVDLKNYMKLHVSNRMIPVILGLAGSDQHVKMNQLSKKDRNSILKIIKAFPLTVYSHLPLENAYVTCGGVSSKSIDPNTLESKFVKGLYFAGEILEGCGPSGGFNLQQAFSTGYLAGFLSEKI